MPRRRWRRRPLLARREAVSPVILGLLTTRARLSGAETDSLAMDRLDLFMMRRADSPKLRDVWREHGAIVTADWIEAHPGTRPWGWWAVDATTPRRVIRGAQLQTAISAEWIWRQDWGVPPLAHVRPRGYRGLPTVESQASYLDRLQLLGSDERAQLTPEAFSPEMVNAFSIDAAEIDRLLTRGGAA